MFQPTRPITTMPDLGQVGAPGLQSAPPTIYTQDPEIARLEEKHSIYGNYLPEWGLYLAAYEGGPEMTTASNLWKHTRENEDDYRDRAKKLHYLNYCEELVDFFTNFIFSETIHRDGGTEEAFYQDFIKDVNRKGDSITDFMRQLSEDLKIFGHLYIMVDTPQVNLADGQSSLSLAEEQEQGIRPYWIIIRPEEVTNWIIDDFDNLVYFKRVQEVMQAVGGEIRRYNKYTELYQDRVTITWVNVSDPKEAKIERVDNLENTRGYIPIVICRHKRSKRYPFMGNSFLRDFAKNNREVMNYTSLIQEFLYRQAFNILVKESDGPIAFRSALDSDWGTANVVEYPKGGKAPAYVSPPADPAEYLQAERAKIVAEMFRRAAQETMNELFNGEKSSGFSQAQSFSKTVPFISSQADTLEKIENSLMALTMKMMSDKSWNGKIKYKDRYELTNITDAITQLSSVFRDLQFPSETFVKEELKRLVAELDGKIQPETLKQILTEIDDMDFEAWQETQKEALVGAGKGSSPADQQKSKQSGSMADVAATANNQGASSTRKLRPPKNKKAA